MNDDRQSGFDEADLDGHTLDELQEYLDQGRTPRRDSIESSPGCRLALDALERLQRLSPALLQESDDDVQAIDESWLQRVLGGIAIEARAGRRVPLAPDHDAESVSITEGAIRGIVRAAEYDVPGVVIGGVRFDRPLRRHDEEFALSIDVSVVYGYPVEEATERLRAGTRARLTQQTTLRPTTIDVSVTDVILLDASDTVEVDA